MDRFQKIIVLLFVAGIPAAATPFFPAAVPFCFTAGSTTLPAFADRAVA